MLFLAIFAVATIKALGTRAIDVRHFITFLFPVLDSSLISDKLYHAVIPLDVLSGITSIICLAAISLERKLAVKYPCIHIHLTKKSVIVAILLTWVIGVIFSTAMYVVPKNLHSYRIFTAIIFTLGFIIPLCVIIESYCEIFYSSLNMMKSSNENVTAERELRVAKTISLVISLFIICWSPFFIVNMIYVFCHHCSRPKWPIYISKMLHYSNSMMNFFVYSTRSPEFRNFFKKIICPKKRRKSSQINIPLGELEKSRKISTMSTLSTISCQFDTSRAGLLRSARFSVGETPSISENRLSTIRDSFDELSNLFVIPT